MCDPVTATALALSAGGTFLETREANANAKRVQNAKNQAFATGMTKQQQFADESGAAFGQNVDKQGRDAFDEQATNEQDRFKQAFNRVETPAPDYSVALPSSAPKNVVIARQDATAKADARTDRDVNNQSALNSYGGAMFNQDLSRNNFARLFGNLQDKASRQSALIPIEMQAAGNNASKGPSAFPMIMKAAGMALGAYGAGTGINSFGDKVAFGPLQQGQSWSSMTQPGLFTSLKQLPSKVMGGIY